jgi:hypothetical protein
VSLESKTYNRPFSDTIVPSLEVQQVFATGSSCWGSSANVLVRTEKDIYHLQSRIYEDSMLTEFDKHKEWVNISKTAAKWK